MKGLLAIVLLLLLVAGCAGSPRAAEAGPTSASVRLEEGSGLGVIAGRVLDDESRPLPAELVLLEAQQSTKADESGRFAFNDVPPGTYRLVAQHLGFEARGLSVEALADRIVNVNLTLRPIALDAGPIHFMTPYEGIIQCSVNFLYPASPCDDVTGAEKDQFVFKILTNLTFKEGIFELTWKPTTAATSQELELDVCDAVPGRTEDIVCFDNEEYNEYRQGPPPVVLRLSDMPVTKVKEWLVGAGSGFASPYPVYQQSFTIYATLCYRDRCADDYTALPK